MQLSPDDLATRARHTRAHARALAETEPAEPPHAGLASEPVATALAELGRWRSSFRTAMAVNAHKLGELAEETLTLDGTIRDQMDCWLAERYWREW